MAFWNFLAVGNWASKFYKFAMQDVIAVQMALQNDVFLAVSEFEKSLKHLSIAGERSKNRIEESLTAFSNSQATKITEAWAQLLPQLITK